MTITRVTNFLRRKAISLSRAYKDVFLAGDGPSRAGEHVLADLRKFCLAQETSFDPDALIMARRAGRRDVWLRINRSLNLDEAQVQKLMEIDDGD